MDSVTALLALFVFLFLYSLYRRFTRVSLADIPGPPAESFLLGNLRQVFQSPVGEVDFQWQDQFGGVARIQGPFGDDRLWISDSKALQYIIQTSGYNFPKQPERRAISRLIGDHGIVWADGDTHRRQRKVMLPAFGMPESKALFPLFTRCAQSITSKWKDQLCQSSDQSGVFNLPHWLARATLDAIGEAAFDCSFGVVDGQSNELIQGYEHFMTGGLGSPSTAKIFLQDISRLIPMNLLDLLYDHFPSASLNTMRTNRDITHRFAKDLLDHKSDSIARGKGSRDVMSILVRANTSENEKARLSDFEMISQMRTLLLAGHETTSNTLGWGFLELAKNPKIQTKLRKEIHAMEAEMRSRGQTEFTVSDLENMPYTQAVLKEVLRMHPVVFHNYRQAGRDDVIPLAKPIKTKSGKVIGEIPIPKGTRVVLAIAAYNRDPDVWGEDSHTFNPDRWLTPKTKRGASVGVFSNLLTFSGGLRSCLGWRFALYEMQAFLVELISNFEFAITEDIKRLRREPCIVMVPVLEGELEKGAQLPLKISIAQRECE